MGGQRVNEMTNQLLRANEDMLSHAKKGGMDTISKEQRLAYIVAYNDLLMAIRIDLGVEYFDLLTDRWYLRSQGEAHHQRLREKTVKMLTERIMRETT
jgi:hypothetical protein